MKERGNASSNHQLFWRIGLLLTVAIQSAQGSILSAKSPSQADVVKAIEQAKEGDVVNVPAGTATWSTPLAIERAITLAGAGIGRTIILDNLQSDENNIHFNGTRAGRVYRLTGFEFRDGTGGKRSKGSNLKAIFGRGSVLVDGTTKTFRIDHCKFDRVLNRSVCLKNAVCGVIDHCSFVTNKAQCICIYHDTWAGGAWGDGSWAAPLSFGTDAAVYIEDNEFRSDPPIRLAMLDEYGGARFVFRHNKATNTVIGSHGTGSSGRFRSVRQWEIYDNEFSADPPTSAEVIHMRGGTGVVFNNTCAGTKKFLTLHTYRYHTSFPKWPGSDGTSAWDRNDPKVYASGKAGPGSGIGPNQIGGTLVVPGVHWSSNQWAGYTVRNLDGQSNLPPPRLHYRSPPGAGSFFSAIVSNTSDTIIAEPGSQQPNKIFAPGDRFEIRRVIQGLDMIGASTGDLLSSNNSPSPVWLHQQLEPVYVWGNSFNGIPNGGVAVAADTPIKEGTHFFNNREKPKYKPFVYPHPLVTDTRGP